MLKIKRLAIKYKRFGAKYIFRELRVFLRQWILEDKANDGLGGPPNNWQSSKLIISDFGKNSGDYIGYSCRFNNDAHEIWINREEVENGERHCGWAFYCNASVFRKMALWYLWRWSWGEWFGLRRWLYYRWLRSYVKKHLYIPNMENTNA